MGQYIQENNRAQRFKTFVRISEKKEMFKLTRERYANAAVRVYYVVYNSFHPPKHFMDGVKLYGGQDSWTYDNFASFDTEKYYAVFAYDDVPNYSEATIVRYDPLAKY